MIAVTDKTTDDHDPRLELRRMLAAQPGSVMLLLQLADLDMRAGDLSEAVEVLERAVGIEPSARVLELLGMALNRGGRHRAALPHLHRALELEPLRASAWNSAGEALGNLGHLAEAVDAFGKAAGCRPDFVQAHYNLGLALRASGHTDRAIDSLRRAVELDPGSAEALHALGQLLHAGGRYQDAVSAFRSLVELRPEDPVALTSLGAAAQMLGDLAAARDCYRRAVDLEPRYADAHNNLGTVYQGLRDMDRAEASFRRAIHLEPDHDDALAGLAANLDRRGRYQEGWDLIRDRLDVRAGNPELVITAAQLLRHLGRSAEAPAILEAALARADLAAQVQQRLAFQLGDVLDDLGRYDEAFEHYRRGNDLKPVRFDRDEYRDDVRRLLDVFSAERRSSLPRLDDPSQRPVFVVGMPRSGTSLAEQILACHPDVAAAGELTDLSRNAIELGAHRGLRFPDSVTAADVETLRHAADDYLSRLDSIDPSARRVIDKTPANHLFIGFIELLFPNARIIHCVRHPLDTELSCYFQNFAGQGIPFSYRLGDIALYFNEYLRVMAHWRRTTRLPLYELIYEELVGDQERVSREMVGFLGLDWDPACLRFHQLDRAVTTASHAQVRRPLYHGSVGRHRQYMRHTGALRSATDWQAWHDSGFADRVEAAQGMAAESSSRKRESNE